MKLIDTLFGKIYYEKRVKVIKKIRGNPLRREKPKETKLTPKKAKKILLRGLGKNFSCPRCCSRRVKQKINCDSITERTVTVHLQCKKCGWAAMSTLNIVYEKEQI